MRSVKIDKLLFFCVVSAASVLALLTYWLPVYTDVIVHKSFIARTFLEGGKTFSVSAQCPSFSVEVPWFAWPNRVWNHLLYARPSLAMFQLLGAGSFVFLMATWSFLSQPEKSSSLSRALLVLSLSSVGCVFYLLQMNRPEQTLNLVLAAVLSLALIGPKLAETLPKRIALLSGLLILTGSGIDVHGKMFFFLPLVLVSGYLVAKSKAEFAGFFLVLLLMTRSGLHYWAGRSLCSEVPEMEKVFKSFFFDPAKLFASPFDMLGVLFANLWDRWTLYFEPTFFQTDTQGHWLPAVAEDWLSSKLNAVLSMFFGFFTLLSLGLILARAFFRAERKNASLILSLALLASSTATWMFQIARNFYEAAFAVPLVFTLFLLNANFLEAKAPRFFRLLLTGTALIALSSQFVLLKNFAPRVFEGVKPDRVFAQTDILIPAVDVKLLPSLEKLASSCGLANSSDLQHVLLDDATFLHFGATKWPLHVMYLTDFWGMGIDSLPKFLQKQNSDGVLTSCLRLPETLRKNAHEAGPYCCLSKKELFML